MKGKWTKVIAVASVLASVPLFFTYQIKHGLLPQGYLFVFLFSGALIGVVVVPALFIVETLLIVVSTRLGLHEVRRWHIGAAVVAGLAECVFLIARNL
jgi:hypothetical protein